MGWRGRGCWLDVFGMVGIMVVVGLLIVVNF